MLNVRQRGLGTHRVKREALDIKIKVQKLVAKHGFKIQNVHKVVQNLENRKKPEIRPNRKTKKLKIEKFKMCTQSDEKPRKPKKT